MAGQRIHKLAAEWGVKSKDILDRLKRMGMDGKKAQSSLSEAEAARVYEEMGLRSEETPTEPASRMVEVRGSLSDEITAYDTITERRVRRGVVLRRTRRTEVSPEGLSGVPHLEVAPGIHAPTAVKLAPDVLCSLAPNEFAYAASPAVETVPQSVDPSIVEPSSSPVVGENGHDSAAAVGLDAGATALAGAEGGAEAGVVVAVEHQAGTATTLDQDADRENAPVEEPDKLAEELLSHAQAAEQARLEREKAEAEAAEAAGAAENAPAAVQTHAACKGTAA